MTHSAINLIRTDIQEVMPSAPEGAVLISSASAGWKGIVLEHHRLAPAEFPEHQVEGHHLSIHTGPPMDLEYKANGHLRTAHLVPGELSFVPHGHLSFPRWQEPYEFLKLALDPAFVARVLRDTSSSDTIEFIERRGVPDPQIKRIALLLREELTSGMASGPLFAESLAAALTTHLFAHHAVKRARLAEPSGALHPKDLRRVLDYIEAHLTQEVSLDALSDLAALSPYHFARLFKASTGLPPHRYLLTKRLERAQTLIATTTLTMAEIAVECGFYDQSHFGKQFRREFGMTPNQLAQERRRLRLVPTS